jgi:hypothetical protein
LNPAEKLFPDDAFPGWIPKSENTFSASGNIHQYLNIKVIN